MDRQISNNITESEAILLEDGSLFLTDILSSSELYLEISPKSKMSHFPLYVQMSHSQ